MRAGERKSYQGYEVCLFPLDYLYCTQISGPGSASHCCGTATDWIGTYQIYPYYAPFSCTKIYQDASTVCYINDAPVWTPDGLQQHVIISFTHDDNPPAASHYDQGDLIGHTGTNPPEMVTGDHVHLDQAFDNERVLIDSGITCQFGNRCYYIRNGITPPHCYYLSGNETIAQTLGQSFQTWTQPAGLSKAVLLMLLSKKKRKEDENYGRKRFAGSL